MLENELECEKEVLHVREAELKEIFGDLLLLVHHPAAAAAHSNVGKIMV